MNVNTYENLAALIQPSTTDRELALIAAAATAVAAPQLASDLRDVRDRARAAVRPKTMTDEEIVVRSVMDLGVAELITHATTNAEIDALVVAAEAGCGGPIFGLKEELRLLRDAEAAEWRVKVDEAKRQFEAEEFGDDADAGRVFMAGKVGDPIRICIPDPVSGKAVPVIASGPVPPISNLGEVFEEDYVLPVESGCRFAHRN